MAFTYDLTTDLGKVRRDIGDTVSAEAHFADDELQSFIDEGGNAKSASGLALLAWAVALSREDEQVKAGSWQGDRRDVAGKMQKLSAQYLEMGGYEPAEAAPSFRSSAIDWTPSVRAERIIQGEQ